MSAAVGVGCLLTVDVMILFASGTGVVLGYQVDEGMKQQQLGRVPCTESQGDEGCALGVGVCMRPDSSGGICLVSVSALFQVFERVSTVRTQGGGSGVVFRNGSRRGYGRGMM